MSYYRKNDDHESIGHVDRSTILMAKAFTKAVTGRDPLDDLRAMNTNDFSKMDEIQLRKKRRKLERNVKLGKYAMYLGLAFLVLGLIGIITQTELLFLGVYSFLFLGLGAFMKKRDTKSLQTINQYLQDNFES